MSDLAGVESVAVVVVRDGRLPVGAEEATAEASGRVVLAGTGLTAALEGLGGATEAWLAQSGLVQPASLSLRLAPALEAVPLVILPASPDGRDLAPRLAARLGRPLLAGAVRCSVAGGRTRADLLRVDGRVVLPADCDGPAVATLMPGSRSPLATAGPPSVHPLALPAPTTGVADAATERLVEPDPATMDLAEARRVLGGGAGLVPRGATEEQSREVFELLRAVAAALGASAGATRVVTDAGWMGYDRQIGTTGVAIDPDLYVAFGVSGASQHIGGLGSPDATVSVNTDPSCPMTSMADLAVVADAPGVLRELARRREVPVPHFLDHRPAVTA